MRRYWQVWLLLVGAGIASTWTDRQAGHPQEARGKNKHLVRQVKKNEKKNPMLVRVLRFLFLSVCSVIIVDVRTYYGVVYFRGSRVWCRTGGSMLFLLCFFRVTMCYGRRFFRWVGGARARDDHTVAFFSLELHAHEDRL